MFLGKLYKADSWEYTFKVFLSESLINLNSLISLLRFKIASNHGLKAASLHQSSLPFPFPTPQAVLHWNSSCICWRERECCISECKNLSTKGLVCSVQSWMCLTPNHCHQDLAHRKMFFTYFLFTVFYQNDTGSPLSDSAGQTHPSWPSFHTWPPLHEFNIVKKPKRC